MLCPIENIETSTKHFQINITLFAIWIQVNALLSFHSQFWCILLLSACRLPSVMFLFCARGRFGCAARSLSSEIFCFWRMMVCLSNYIFSSVGFGWRTFSSVGCWCWCWIQTHAGNNFHSAVYEFIQTISVNVQFIITKMHQCIWWDSAVLESSNDFILCCWELIGCLLLSSKTLVFVWCLWNLWGLLSPNGICRKIQNHSKRNNEF